MSSPAAPNVSGIGIPGRRTVYSMCDMCAVRCPMEVTAEDGRVTWLRGNTYDPVLGASLCAKGGRVAARAVSPRRRIRARAAVPTGR